MCLIVLAWRTHPSCRLVVAANRDEFHRRPAAAAGFWRDHPEILAGRDLEAMGTWMGVARSGRFAAVTNFRGAREPSAEQSRGALVVDFLKNDQAPAQYVAKLRDDALAYSGFNLLACDGKELWWMSNRGGEPRALPAGIYGLANDLLDSPDVQEHKGRFAAAIPPAPAIETLFAVLDQARIVNAEYGTRCSTILVQSDDRRTRYAERSFAADGSAQDTAQFDF